MNEDNVFTAIPVTLDEFALATLKGLMASGAPVSYDTAHQAWTMAQYMTETKPADKQYVW